MELRVVMPAEDSWEGPTETISGRLWRVSELIAITGAASFPSYHTVSYSWGKTTASNLFGQPGEISARTRGALEAAIKSKTGSETQRYWIDAVCVPSNNPQRLHTLESMGFIYAQADTCIVVLENLTWNVVSQASDSPGPLPVEDMQVLDNEPWTSSVWTYQEIVNQDVITFTTYNLQWPVQLPGQRVFNMTGFSLERWKKENAKSELDSLRTFPGLNTLVNALADSELNRYLEISAMTSLTGIAGRFCNPTRPANRLYALYGLLSQGPSWGTAQEEDVINLTNKAMAMCEMKQDFSFIFTSNSRELGANRTWRPQPDPEFGFVPIICWNSWGEKQSGVLHGDGLELHEMVQLELTQGLTVDSVTFLRDILRGFQGIEVNTSDSIESKILATFEELGLKTNARSVPCDRGLVIWNSEIMATETVEPYASTEIAWTFGHPGIAKTFEQGVFCRCVPFLYVGASLRAVEPKVNVKLFG